MIHSDPLGPRTDFLRQTMARAILPRWRQRAKALQQMEGLIAIQKAGFSVGMKGHLLGSIARSYPVSHRAIRMELYGYGFQPLVEVAEQVELGITIRRLGTT